MEMVENILGKGENAGCQHFLLNPVMFSKAFVMCNFSFSSSVFKRLVLQTHKSRACLGKGLTFMFDIDDLIFTMD